MVISNFVYTSFTNLRKICNCVPYHTTLIQAVANVQWAGGWLSLCVDVKYQPLSFYCHLKGKEPLAICHRVHFENQGPDDTHMLGSLACCMQDSSQKICMLWSVWAKLQGLSLERVENQNIFYKNYNKKSLEVRSPSLLGILTILMSHSNVCIVQLWLN